jgi:hypothetical protein
MRSSRMTVLTRLCSGAAVAAIAAAGTLAPATAASAATTHHAHKARTHLFIAAHPVRGTHHKSDVILGLLRSRGHGLAGETVILESRTAHTRFSVVGSATTRKHGLVRFTVTPTRRTAYVLVFKGDATHRRCHSPVIILRAPRKS